jgi:ketosteroid isomerase-like protein
MRPAGALALLVLAACATLPERDLKEDLVSLAASENAFARLAGERGMKTAFLEFLAADAVIFRPGPVNGRAWFESRPDRPGVLAWYPSVVEVADAGDFGYTTGPSSFRADPASQRPDWTGYFVSVWKREPNGMWKVAADIGIDLEFQSAPEAPWVPPAFPMPHAYRFLAGPDREKELLSLMEAEESLARTAKAGGPALAFKAHASPRIRLHRPGRLAKGSASASMEAAAPGEQWFWMVRDAAVASSGDLGYAHGTWQAVRDGAGPATGVFFRVWGRPLGAEWKVLLDLADTDPPPPPKP